MPQPRRYADNAQKQAAYRQRKGRKATQSELAMLALSLNAVIETAIENGEFPLPQDLLAARPEETLRNLIRFFDPIYDPVRNPHGKHKRPERQRATVQSVKPIAKSGAEKPTK